MSPNTTPVAFFDFDGTLTRGDTFMPFLRHVVGPGAYAVGLMRMAPTLMCYLLGVVRNDVAKERVLSHFLAGHSYADIARCGETFARDVLPTKLNAAGMERVAWHQSQGHECVIVSASPDVYLAPWAKHHGFTALLCTHLEEENGVLTGRLHGKNCHGREKVARIKTWLRDRLPEATYAYGDSKADLYMLRLADQGFYWRARRFDRVQA